MRGVGFLLLSGLSYLLARARNVKPLSEIIEHAAVAATVILIGQLIGMSTRVVIGSA